MTLAPDHLRSNQPPPAETAGMDIDTALAELEARKAEILAAFTPERLVVTDHATAGTTADKIAIAKAFLAKVDRLRQDVKAPYDLATKTVDGRSAAFVQAIRDAIDEGYRLVREFRTAERDRAAKALEEQRAEEARLRAEALAVDPAHAANMQDQEDMMDCYQFGTVPAPAAEPEPVRAEEIHLPAARGDYGGKVHQTKETTYRIVNVRKLPDQILKAPAVQKAMLAAIKQLGRLQAEIPGVEITIGAGDIVRRAG